mmetsp:Transcript_68292/g.79504  ORF Transcript_68292/g.79504 Transcript_68292/m.79504 type:complete len:490 (-) Transcript_68292:130-1599(-)
MLRVTRIYRHAPSSRSPGESVVVHYAKVGWEAVRHLYHGFRLFFLNTSLAWKYSQQMRNGVALTRRERQLLESATMDLLRLVPFSFFIIVPFAELLLPITLKMFPDLIPSTFETEAQGRNKAYQSAMQTLLARQRKTEYMTSTMLAIATDHIDILRRVAVGDSLDRKQIKSIAHLFARDGPLGINQLPPHILICLSRTTGVYKGWHAVTPQRFLVPQLRRALVQHYTKLKRDDFLLAEEGLDGLTEEELRKANQVRGMRWAESKETLRVQLEWWVSLAKDPRVPYNTLFWVKPTRNSLRKTMEGLPMEQRRQLLGIQHLPEHVRSSLEKLCENVEGSKEAIDPVKRPPSGADDIVQKIEEKKTAAQSTGKDLDVQDAQLLLGNYLTATNVRRIFEEVRLEKPPTKPVTVADVTDHLGPDVGISSLIVSNIFDAFDFGSGNKEITEANLISIGARCREETKKKQSTPPPAKQQSSESSAKKEDPAHPPSL